jgi:hypothetical protein
MRRSDAWNREGNHHPSTARGGAPLRGGRCLPTQEVAVREIVARFIAPFLICCTRGLVAAGELIGQANRLSEDVEQGILSKGDAFTKIQEALYQSGISSRPSCQWSPRSSRPIAPSSPLAQQILDFGFIGDIAPGW